MVETVGKLQAAHRAGRQGTNGRARGTGANGTAVIRAAESAEAQVLRREIDAIGPWFHNLRLPVDGAAGEHAETAPDHPLGDFPSVFWSAFGQAVPDDLTGKSVLDIGCNGGFYSFEMQRRGAARVLGIDHDPVYLRQAEFARERLGLSARDVEFRRLGVYDVDQLAEQFDLVFFMGVLYHLRHPLYALEKVAGLVRCPGGRLVFQTMERGVQETVQVAEDYPFAERGIFYDERFPRMYFVEHRYAGDWTNWWIPNPAATQAMLRSCGLDIVERPCGEVYVCAPKDAVRLWGRTGAAVPADGLARSSD
ncbi:MAG: Methyltransferase type 11 [uncultured Chloroflexi bacterium]|uniref:Methyltransferase type 11 n=1 Tax=uncultured Chloroflexota bacterium TaxID=166587 RepID=A0A6J4J3Q4_9CHLR|nr:MAG: Methyltransferase type 11 [uncultured Chloroflexota bacterium]